MINPTIVRTNLGIHIKGTCWRDTTLLIGVIDFAASSFLQDNGLAKLEDVIYDAKIYPAENPSNKTSLYVEFPSDTSIAIYVLDEVSKNFPSDMAEWYVNFDLPGIDATNIAYGSVKFKGPGI